MCPRPVAHVLAWGVEAVEELAWPRQTRSLICTRRPRRSYTIILGPLRHVVGCFDNALLDASRHQTHGSLRSASQTPGLSHLSHTPNCFSLYNRARGGGEAGSVPRTAPHLEGRRALITLLQETGSAGERRERSLGRPPSL